jgi:hypothetical protein
MVGIHDEKLFFGAGQLFSDGQPDAAAAKYDVSVLLFPGWLSGLV